MSKLPYTALGKGLVAARSDHVLGPEDRVVVGDPGLLGRQVERKLVRQAGGGLPKKTKQRDVQTHTRRAVRGHQRPRQSVSQSAPDTNGHQVDDDGARTK